MDTALPQKFPFILNRNLAKANCTGNHVCTSCDTVVLAFHLFHLPKGLSARIFSKVKRPLDANHDCAMLIAQYIDGSS